MSEVSDVWTENSIEVTCDHCESINCWYLFIESKILYGDCAACEHQQKLFDLARRRESRLQCEKAP